MEAKNIREWLYPDRDEIKDLFSKCCDLDAIPVLIGRRIPYATFTLLNPCGVIIHQTYNQLYPAADRELAVLVMNKRLLGYHDVRIGNEPDNRLVKFIHVNLPKILAAARERFEQFKDLLSKYGNRSISYQQFAADVRNRQSR